MAVPNACASTFDVSMTATRSKLRRSFYVLPSPSCEISASSNCCSVVFLNCFSTTSASQGSTPVALNAFSIFLRVNEVV